MQLIRGVFRFSTQLFSIGHYCGAQFSFGRFIIWFLIENFMLPIKNDTQGSSSTPESFPSLSSTLFSRTIFRLLNSAVFSYMLSPGVFSATLTTIHTYYKAWGFFVLLSCWQLLLACSSALRQFLDPGLMKAHKLFDFFNLRAALTLESVFDYSLDVPMYCFLGSWFPKLIFLITFLV